MLDVCCCARAFSSCGELGLLLVVVPVSHCGGFSGCGAQTLGVQASVVAARRLASCVTRVLERAGFSSCVARAQ